MVDENWPTISCRWGGRARGWGRPEPKSWSQVNRTPLWEYDPIATQVMRAVEIRWRQRTCPCAWSEFVDPVRNVVKRLRVHNDFVEPFLKREINKACRMKKKKEDEALTINRGLTIKNMNDESGWRNHRRATWKTTWPKWPAGWTPKVEMGPRSPRSHGPFLRPSSIGHVEGGLLTEKVLEKKKDRRELGWLVEKKVSADVAYIYIENNGDTCRAWVCFKKFEFINEQKVCSHIRKALMQESKNRTRQRRSTRHGPCSVAKLGLVGVCRSLIKIIKW